MVVGVHDDVLGSRDLSMERGKLKKKCKTLERENFTARKELAEFAVSL